MAPKRPAQPPPPASSEETASSSGSSDEEEEVNLASPLPAQTPAPKKPTGATPTPRSAAADEDAETSDEDEEEDGESSGSESDSPRPTKAPPTPTPSSQAKPPPPNAKPAPESDSDADESDSGDGANAKPDPKPDKMKAKATAEPEKKKAKPSPSGEAKKPPFHRIWSPEDEVTILNVLADYRKNHGALPLADTLVASLSDRLSNKSCNRKELIDKARNLRRKYVAAAKKAASRGSLPTKEHDLHLYNLSKKIWGEKPGDTATLPATTENGGATTENGRGQTEGESSDGEANAPGVRREYDELRNLYPDLAEEVDELEETHPCGGTLKRAFERIGDAKARALDIKIKKQRVAETKMLMRRGDLTKEVTKTLVDLVNVD